MSLRPGELAALRAAYVPRFTSSATVQRVTRVQDTSGGFVDTYTAGETYDCSFSMAQVTPTERENTIGVQTIAVWRFVFPAGSDVRSTDRLLVGTRTFEVVHAGARSLEITLLALCQEIT